MRRPSTPHTVESACADRPLPDSCAGVLLQGYSNLHLRLLRVSLQHFSARVLPMRAPVYVALLVGLLGDAAARQFLEEDMSSIR